MKQALTIPLHYLKDSLLYNEKWTVTAAITYAIPLLASMVFVLCIPFCTKSWINRYYCELYLGCSTLVYVQYTDIHFVYEKNWVHGYNYVSTNYLRVDTNVIYILFIGISFGKNVFFSELAKKSAVFHQYILSWCLETHSIKFHVAHIKKTYLPCHKDTSPFLVSSRW